MIASIGRTILAAQSWPTMDLAEVARSLAGPFNDDYNQFHSCYQCHGSPIGKVYVNTPWPAVCFDVDNEVMYLKQDLAISHNGWQSAVVPPVNDPVFDNLTHYWSMDESSGTRIDSVGSVNLPEIIGPIPSAVGKDSNCADMTASGGKTLKAAVLNEYPLSFVMWMKVTSLPSPVVSTMTANGGDGTLNAGITDVGGECRLSADSGGGNITDVLITLGDWHLVVINDSDDGVFVSVDGAAFVKTGDSAGPPESGPLEIGDHNINALTYFDEVMIFFPLLTQGNVTTLWNGGAGKFYRP